MQVSPSQLVWTRHEHDVNVISEILEQANNSIVAFLQSLQSWTWLPVQVDVSWHSLCKLFYCNCCPAGFETKVIGIQFSFLRFGTKIINSTVASLQFRRLSKSLVPCFIPEHFDSLRCLMSSTLRCFYWQAYSLQFGAPFHALSGGAIRLLQWTWCADLVDLPVHDCPNFSKDWSNLDVPWCTNTFWAVDGSGVYIWCYSAMVGCLLLWGHWIVLLKTSVIRKGSESVDFSSITLRFLVRVTISTAQFNRKTENNLYHGLFRRQLMYWQPLRSSNRVQSMLIVLTHSWKLTFSQCLFCHIHNLCLPA